MVSPGKCSAGGLLGTQPSLPRGQGLGELLGGARRDLQQCGRGLHDAH